MSKKYRFLGHDTAISCSSCEFGTLSPDRKSVMCKKIGVTNPSYSCKKYKFSPLHRMPQATRVLFEDGVYKKEDFDL